MMSGMFDGVFNAMMGMMAFMASSLMMFLTPMFEVMSRMFGMMSLN